MDSLMKAREEIARIDREIAMLFEERMHAVATVASYKMEHGLPILDEGRERELIERNSAYIKDEVIRSYYVTYQKSAMAISRAYQENILSGMRVAYAGCEGAFAHLATERLFPTARKVPYGDFALAYAAVERGDAEVCVLPIENSYNGEVGAVMDLMFSGGLFLTGILELPVTQDLLVLPGTKLSDIKTVVSHPQALAQCGVYLQSKGWQTMEYSNTALAAKYVKETGDGSIAAIASEVAAEVFGLEVIERNVNAATTNTTRFAVFSRTPVKREGDSGVHSVLLFTVRNEAGSLARAIDIIGRFGFNMRTLRSRPMKDLLWEYYFYVETEGNMDSPVGKSMQAALSPICDKLRVVGTYLR